MSENLNFKWRFETHISDTSVARGFINNDIERFNKEPLKSIVREAIQNSSDALDSDNGEKQVIIKIKRGEIRKDLLPNFSDIEQHIRRCYNLDGNDNTSKREIQRHIDEFEKSDKYNYIEISDYKTTGMSEQGLLALTQSDDRSHKQKNSAQGSKGVGKAAYFAASYLRTIIVSTKSNEGFRFRGTAKISTHEDPFETNKKLKEQGFYGDRHCISTLVVPELFRRNEFGTSIFIIGSWDYDNFENNVIKEVLRNYWLAIETGQLVVEVEDVSLDRDNIQEYMDDIFNTYKDYRTGENQNPKPYYETYKKGLRFDGHIVNIGDCKLWLYRNDEFNLGAVARFRKTKMYIYKGDEIHAGYAGVFLCDDEDGNEFLRDIENDAHDTWNANINPFRKKEAGETLRAIKDFIKKSYYEYTGEEDEKAFSVDLLDNMFSFNEVKESVGSKPAPMSLKIKDEEPASRDRLIGKHSFETIEEKDSYIYTLKFNAQETKKEQKIKVFIGTDSSRDRIDVLNVDNGIELKEGCLIMDVKKGENIVEGIVLDSPFLVAPIITIE